MAQSGSEFIVKFNGIKLPREVEDRLEREIRVTVMRELAKTDLAPPISTQLAKMKYWRGIWLDLAGKLKVPTLTTVAKAQE